MAAYRSGIKTVLIPKENMPDLYEVEDVVKQHVEFVPVERIEQVLNAALVKMPSPSVSKEEKHSEQASAAVPAALPLTDGKPDTAGAAQSGICQ